MTDLTLLSSNKNLYLTYKKILMLLTAKCNSKFAYFITKSNFPTLSHSRVYGISPCVENEQHFFLI